MGFQNHTHRGVPWTGPENEERIPSVTETHLVVDPVSFVHEQSETLAELDHELKAFAEGHGKVFHRIPVPHDHEAFPAFLATLVEEVLRASGGQASGLAPCRCRPGSGTWCTNGARDLPESPFTPALRAETTA